MSKMLSVVYCDRIQNDMTDKGPVRSIVTPLSELNPISIPGNYSFSIACVMAGFDITKNNKIEIGFYDPDGNLNTQIMNLVIAANSITVPDGRAFPEYFNLDLDVRNAILLKEGEYNTRIKHNDIELGNYPILVRARR